MKEVCMHMEGVESKRQDMVFDLEKVMEDVKILA